MAAQTTPAGRRGATTRRRRAGSVRGAATGPTVVGRVDLGQSHGPAPDAEGPGDRPRPAGRVSREARARRLLKGGDRYVYDPRFDRPDAAATFLGPAPAGAPEAPTPAGAPAGRSPYVASLYSGAALLRPEEEAPLFLRMNYLKHRAARLLEALDPATATASDLGEIERLRAEARAVRDRIVRANLRLVASIARRRTGPGRDFYELVSDGNLALVLAVDQFDAARGFRFCTYATCAISKNLNRAFVREGRRSVRFVTGRHAQIEADPDPRAEPAEEEEGRDRVEGAVHRILVRLSDRERAVITARFGLNGDRGKSLRQIASEMGVTKERVRQIEVRARAKLRGFAQLSAR